MMEMVRDNEMLEMTGIDPGEPGKLHTGPGKKVFIYTAAPCDVWTGAISVDEEERETILALMPEESRDDKVYKSYLPGNGYDLEPVYFCKADNNGTTYIFSNFEFLCEGLWWNRYGEVDTANFSLPQKPVAKALQILPDWVRERLSTYAGPHPNEKWKMDTDLSNCTDKEKNMMSALGLSVSLLQAAGLNRGDVAHVLYGYRYAVR